MAKISSGPMPLDWDVYLNDRNREVFEVVTSHGTASDPVDLTGAVVTAQARATAPDPVVAAAAVAVVTEPLLGRFTVEWPVLPPLDGAESWKGVFDIQIVEAGETLPKTLLRGAFVVVHDVTREDVTP
jgi:hypothetical protein